MSRNTSRSAVPATTGAQPPAKAAHSDAQPLVLPADLQWATHEHNDYTADVIAVPFIRPLQQLSPQVDPNAPEHVQGAAAGMLYNTATGELYDGVNEGVVVIPVAFQRDVTEWTPRAAGGGLVARHGADLTQLQRLGLPDANGKRFTAEGTELVDAALYYVLLVKPDGVLEQAVISMASSGWKAARQWNSRQKLLRVIGPDGKPVLNPAPFLAAWRMRTVWTSNDRGKWYAWDIPTFECYTTEVAKSAPYVWDLIKSMLDGVRKGTVTAAHEVAGADAPLDEEVPF
jgi:hypothetical protein